MNIHTKLQMGFTLIELMITLSIAAVLLVIAVPNFSNMIKDNCMITKTNLFVASLQYARSEAIKRNALITMSTTGTAANNEWGDGWTISVNNNVGNNIELKTIQAECTNTTLDEKDSKRTFTYRGDGFIVESGELTICDDRKGEKGRVITISNTGRPNLTKKMCS